jgi:hypothetical protein
MELEKINTILSGHTVLSQFDLASQKEVGRYDLLIKLVDKPGSCNFIALIFYQVGKLELEIDANGIVQLLVLRVAECDGDNTENCSRFFVCELERRSLAFSCQSFELLDGA